MKEEETLSIDLVFRSPLAAGLAGAINVLVYAEYDNVIETDSNRNVIKGATGVNTIQLAQVLTKHPFTEESFAGVYACDQLSFIEINKYPKSFVVNTDPMELSGTHWIAIYFSEQMKGEFFDSCGKHLIHYNRYFLDFMNRNAVEWEHNKIQLQSVDNTVYSFCIIAVGNWTDVIHCK